MLETVSAAPAPGAASDGYWFDERAAQAAVDFFPRFLRFTTGEWAGRPFILEPWQSDFVRKLFGWKRADGTRRYRRAYLWVPRKNGKTELAAGIAILMLIGDAEMGGQVYSIAATEDQAKIVFEKATQMVGWSEDLSRELTAFKTSIWCPQLAASFKPMPGKARGKTGYNMSGLVGDELHEWLNDALLNFLHQSTGARRQPLEVLISSAGKRGGFGFEAFLHCQKILAGDIVEPDTLVVIYAAPKDADWSDEKVWRAANPNFGVSVRRDFLATECAKARNLPRLENDFRRYYLNQWTEQAVRWLPLHLWDEGAKTAWKDLREQLKGRRAFGGIDLSSTTDLTCIVWTFPPEEAGGRWHVVPRFYMPQGQLERRVKVDKVPYDDWERQGALTLTPGNVADYAYIKRDILADAEHYKVEKIAVDRWNATQTAVELGQEGLDVVLFGQGFASMSAPSKVLERLVLGCQIEHGGHPVLRWCIGNTAVETDAAENLKPSKKHSTERIDGTVGLVEGIGVAIAGGEPDLSLDDFIANPIIVSTR